MVNSRPVEVDLSKKFVNCSTASYSSRVWDELYSGGKDGHSKYSLPIWEQWHFTVFELEVWTQESPALFVSSGQQITFCCSLFDFYSFNFACTLKSSFSTQTLRPGVGSPFFGPESES